MVKLRWPALILLFAWLVHSAEQLIFSDDFDTFDLSVWEHEITMGGGGNWEFQYFTNNRTNSYVKNGILYLKPTLTSELIGEGNVRNGYTMDLWGSNPANLCTGNAFYGCMRASGGGNIINPVQSARLRTASSTLLKYGRVEVRAKIPKGDWIWPAIWMLPRYDSYGGWPASGEIDIMESRGNTAYSAGGIDHVSSTLHWGPFWSENGYSHTTGSHYLKDGTSFNDAFHTFGLVWNQHEMYTYLDDPSQRLMEVVFDKNFWDRGGWGNKYNNPWAGRPNAAPFDQPFYLIMNVAVGGTTGFFPEGVGNKPWTNTEPHAAQSFLNAKDRWYPTWKGEDSALQVDWVKIWKQV